MAISEDWLTQWREADFSWEGLAKHELQGWVVADGVLREVENGRIYGQPIPETQSPVSGRAATLQDYWRVDSSTGRLRDDVAMGAELITALYQPTYHIAHLPPVYANKTPTGKGGWPDDALDAIVSPRLAAASETQWEGPGHDRKIAGPDRDAQFQGGVWLKAPRHPRGKQHPVCLRLNSAAILGYCDFAQTHFSGEARFEDVAFGDYATFEDAALIGARFQRAAFGGMAEFQDTAFSGDVTFEDAAFSGAAWFLRTAFGAAASFEGATFGGDADFDSAAFTRTAQFSEAAFHGAANFHHAAFTGTVQFEEAAFHGAADFHAAEFGGAARFGRAAFSGDARFEDAAFRGATFAGAAFSGPARFQRAAFSGSAWFEDAVFSGPARFEGATFRGHAQFGTSTFSSQAYFDAVTFGADMNFTSATFDKLASFERIEWPDAAQHWHGAFEQVVFQGTLSLTGSGLRSFAAFDGARLEGGLQIDEANEQSANARFKAERRAAIAAARADGGAFAESANEERKQKDKEKAVPVSRAEIAAHTKAQRDTRLRELERGCRVLKLAFERAANKSREQMLYRFELQARRAQKKLPPGEALFSDLYALASDYGASMVRPFIALFVLIVLFGATYFGCAYALGLVADPRDLRQASQAIEFSLTNTFRPLSALSTEGLREDTLGAALLRHDDFTALGVRALSIVQSLLAIVLVFLFALAVRRRFQIS